MIYMGAILSSIFTGSVITGDTPVVESYEVANDATDTATVNKPSGVEVGDLLVFIVCDDSGSSTIHMLDDKTDWTLAASIGGNQPDTQIGVWYKVADGTEGASESYGLTITHNWIGWYLRISGAHTTQPINNAITSKNGTVTTLTLPSVTTNAVNCLVLGVGAQDGGGDTFTVESTNSWVEGDQVGRTGISAVWAEKDQETKGATGDATVTSDGSDGSTQLQIAINRQTETPAEGAHPFWRFLFKENWSENNTSAISCSDFEVRESTGGADVLGDGVLTGDSELSGSYTTANITDGNTANFWVSNNNTGDRGAHWLQVEFSLGEEKDINEFVFASRADSYGVNEAPTFIEVQYSDNGTDWTTKWLSSTQSSWTSSGDSRTFTSPATTPSVVARYWMIEGINNNSDRATAAFSAAEFEFRATVSGSDETGSGTAFALSSNSTSASAFDDDDATYWVTSNSGGNHYIGYDLGSGNDVEIVEVEYTNRPPSFGQDESIIEASLLYSHDTGDIKSWIRHLNLATTQDFGTSQETRVFSSS